MHCLSPTTMSIFEPLCPISSNPDIAGIGVRTAIYAQNLLSFIPAFWTISDKKVEEFELESVEAQSTTILITAFAILVSAIIQARTNEGLPSFYGNVILNLSWMNNTNTFIWFLLFIEQQSWVKLIKSLKSWLSFSGRHPDNVDPEKQKEAEEESSKRTTLIKAMVTSPVVIIGSIHLSLMAALGIWLWSNPQKFSDPCNSPISLLGSRIPLTSVQLHNWSILVYSMVAIPGLNLVIPMLFILPFYIIHHHFKPLNSPTIIPTAIGLVLLAAINIIFLIDTEVMLHSNFLDKGNSDWTFGQTLALLLLLVPLRDLTETMSKRREKKHRGQLTDSLWKALQTEAHASTVKDLLSKGADINAVLRGKLWFISWYGC